MSSQLHRARSPASSPGMSTGADSHMPAITVISCVGGGPMQRLVDSLREQGHEADLWEGHTPEAWRTRMSTKVGRVRARASAMLGFPVRTLIESLRIDDRALVPTTNPFFLPALLVLTRPLHGKTVIPLLYDLYPDTLEATGLSSEGSLLSKLGTRLNRILMDRSEAVVFIGEHMARHVMARYGEPGRWEILATGASTAEHEAGRPAEQREGPPLLLSYVGNLGHVHDWDTVAQGLGSLLGDDVRFVCAASGAGVHTWRRAFGNLPTEKVTFEPPLDDEAWRDLLARTDVALVTLRATAAHTSVPSKAFSAMAAGCAILAVAPAASDLAHLVDKHRCGVVVDPGDVDGFRAAIQRLAHHPEELSSMKAAARRAVADHYDMPVLARRWKDLVQELTENHRPPPGFDTLKRALDLTGAVAGLTVTAPLLAAGAAAVRLTMGRPVLFVQERPGLNGRPFRLYKLRTMRHARPGEDGAEHDAVRLTRVGHLLRMSSIDELPTLFNVLKGDMSLVGPRPLLTRYLERYTPEQARRHEVKPGVTGWAQVNGRNALSWEEKFEHDVWYVDHRSLALDLRILLTTALKVLRREGISASDHATMPEFMGTQG